MQPEDTGKAYDRITHLWQSSNFNRDNGIAEHRRAIQFSSSRGWALDVGCGCTGRFIDLLQGEGFEVEGVDVSTQMIRLARQRHPGVTFYHQDVCNWSLPRSYDFITAWDSIWHVPLEQQQALLGKLVAGLNSGGVMIFSFGSTEEPGEHRDDFMGPEVYYSSLGTNGFVDCLLKLGCQIRHLECEPQPDQHSWLIVQKPIDQDQASA